MKPVHDVPLGFNYRNYADLWKEQLIKFIVKRSNKTKYGSTNRYQYTKPTFFERTKLSSRRVRPHDFARL